MADEKKVTKPSEPDEGALETQSSEEAARDVVQPDETPQSATREEKKPRSIRDIAIDFVKPFNVRNPLGQADDIKKEAKDPLAVEISPDETKPEDEALSEVPGNEPDVLTDTRDEDKADAEASEVKGKENAEETPEPLDPEEEEKRKQAERARIAELELEEALSAAGIDPAVSTCDELRQLAEEIESGKSPWFRKDEVCIQRKPALQLIRGLTALCDAQTGESFEDELFDALASSDHQDEADFKPMYRVKNRAKSIINDAMSQADLIVNDARMVSNSLLQDTEAKIQAKYDEADSEIEARMTTTKEESTKRLSEARDELTASRKQSVDILNLYMSKAEDDYQGYWERAEQTLFASMLKSESVLGKACEIYERELKVIREDLETIEGIMEDLARSRPRA